MESVLDSLKRANQYIKSKGVDGTITYRGESSRLVRAANSQISLSVSEVGEKYFVELQKDKRLTSGSIATSANNTEAINSLIDQLYASLDLMPEIPFLTPPLRIAQNKISRETYDPQVEEMDPDTMRDFFSKAVQQFAGKKAAISGAFSSGMYSYGIINTQSEDPSFFIGTDFNNELVLQLEEEKKELRSSSVGEKMTDYNPEQVIAHMETILNVKQSTPREDISLGKHDIIFGIDAIGELIAFMYYIGFSGEAYEYKMGMLQRDVHRIGDKIFGENITLTDEPENKAIPYRYPFGLNGIPRKNTAFIEKGVLKELCYSDKMDADRFNVKVNNSGSALNMVLKTGDGPADFDSMIKAEKGPAIYIPYLHYMNIPNPTKGEITASSRFGTFFLEDGKIKSHLYNVRILDSLIRMFNNVEWLSSKLDASNISDTYGLRMAQAVSAPRFVKIKDVPIISTSRVDK